MNKVLLNGTCMGCVNLGEKVSSSRVYIKLKKALCTHKYFVKMQRLFPVFYT